MIEAALDEATRLVPISAIGSLVGLAGSVTTVAAIHLGLTKYDPVAIHRARVPASAVREISDRLLVASHASGRRSRPCIRAASTSSPRELSCCGPSLTVLASTR